MGKLKKPRTRAAKRNTVGVPTNISDIDEFDAEDELSGPVQPIMDQLQSVSVEEKMCGLQTLSTLCQNNTNIPTIMESDIVRIAAPLLADRNLNIRHATAGALRNLSACGLDICDTLVDQDVLTPLLALLNEFAGDLDWVPIFDKTMNDQLDVKSDTFLQSVNVVWNLCESSPTALDFFNQSQLLQSFIRCLNWNIYGFDISIAVAQCLLVISEDNPSCWAVLGSTGCELSNVLQASNAELSIASKKYALTKLQIITTGIISNVPALSATYFNQMFQTLSQTLSINHRANLNNLTSILPVDGVDREGFDIEILDDSVLAMDEETEEQASRRRRRADLPTELELEIKHVEWILESQRIAAETLTNICSFDDENQMNEDEEEMSDAESVHDYDQTSQASSGGGNIQNTDKISVEIQEAIKSLALVEKLWQRAQPIAENVMEVLNEQKSMIGARIKKLRISCILCLQNLCNNLTTEDLGGPTGIYAVWLDLGQQAFQYPDDIEFLDATTSLMRAALEHLRHSPELFNQMTNNDLELMVNGVKNCTHSEVQANWLRMLGILGCFLPEPLVRIIITFIIETCSKIETDVWTMSEGMDALMDMFSDNDWNQISYEFGLVQKSRELERIMKNKLRQHKRELGERYQAVATVKTNLHRFSKYVEAELKKFTPANGVK